ncbi:MAG: polysaccharide pyruvyl transferase family protein [Candidatus Hodarchaeota archaeon]
MSWVVYRKMLVKYGRKSDLTFWEDYWKDDVIQNTIIAVKYDKIMQNIFHRYLPRNGKILEAGCGIGQWVIFLREMGYEIEGVDNSFKVINKAKTFNLNAPIIVADILNLPYADGHFKGYISLGVLEHFQNGPHRALIEAKRVMSEGGVLLIAVPYFSPIRKFKAMLKLYNSEQDGEFYEYAFSKTVFLETIRNAGFEIVTTIPIRGLRGLSEEFPFFRRFYKKVFKGRDKISGGDKILSQFVKLRRKCENHLNHFLKVVAELSIVRKIAGHIITIIVKNRNSIMSVLIESSRLKNDTRPIRIVITHVLPDDNPGGSAIAMGMIKTLKAKFADCRVSLVSYYSNKKRLPLIHRHLLKEFPDLEILKTPIINRIEAYSGTHLFAKYIRGFLWVWGMILATIKLFLPSWMLNSTTIKKFKEADIILSRGTQIFYDRSKFPVRKTLALYWISYPILLAKKLKKPYIIYGQSFGPLRRKISQKIVKFVLNRTNLVLVRERLSMDFLISLGIPKHKIKVIPDAAFSLPCPDVNTIKNMCEKFNLPIKNFLAVTVRAWEETCDTDVFLENIADVIDRALDNNFVNICAIVNQVRKGPASAGDDTDVSYRLLKYVKNKEKVRIIDEDFSPLKLLSLYGGAKVLTGTRLHSVILALISGTPSIAISYAGPKTYGIMEMLGMEDYVLDMKKIDINRAYHLLRELCIDNDHKRNEIKDKIILMKNKIFSAPDIVEPFIDRNS